MFLKLFFNFPIVSAVIFSMCFFLGTTQAVSVAPEISHLGASAEIDLNYQWAKRIFSPESVKSSAGLPFSFVYDGRRSSQIIGGWKCEVREENISNTVCLRTLTIADPNTALEVKAVATIYLDTPGVDWTLYFTNKGNKNTPIIEEVKAVDVVASAKSGSDIILHRLKGSTASSTGSQEDWLPFDQTLAPGQKSDFAVPTAFSSYDVCPFFNTDWKDGGVITAIGWTGHWGGSVENTKDAGIRIEAGMRTMRLRLRPGECIRSPRIMQMYWLGSDEWRSYNLFRRTMFNHIVPRMNGEVVVPPIAQTGAAFRESNNSTETIELGYIKSLEGLGFEYYWLDAWWMRGESFPFGMGQYGFPIERVPDPVRFPKGIKPISEAVKKQGMKFIVWFGPEVVYPNTFIAKEHPEWVITPDSNTAGTFDLSNPLARDYMTRYINAAIDEYSIDCFRTDAGPDFQHWQLKDQNEPDRQGITEIRYVEGYYKMWDEIKKDQKVFIDNCCGGGTRIDLETSSRSISLWRTDGTQFPLWKNDWNGAAVYNQMMTASLSRYIPFHVSGQMGTSPYLWRSGLNGGGIAYCEDTRVDGYNREQVKKAIQEAKRMRKYYFGNFYPVSKVNVDTASWCVTQYHRPIEKDGMVIAFRRNESPYPIFKCNLREIDPNAKYSVVYSYGYTQSKPVKVKGVELKNIDVKIEDCPGSVIIEYRELPK